MDEKTQEEIKGKGVEESSPEKAVHGENNSTDGKNKTTPLIDIANVAAERMEKANLKTEELLNRQEQMDARRALGGRSEAGGEPAKKSEDEEWAEDAKKRYEGTGMNPTDEEWK